MMFGTTALLNLVPSKYIRMRPEVLCIRLKVLRQIKQKYSDICKK